MKSKLMCVLAFSLGAAVGSVASWRLLKTKYELLVQEEIDSVKEAFSKKEHKLSGDLDQAHKLLEENRENEKTGAAVCKKITDALGYTSYSDVSKKIKKVEPLKDGEPCPYTIVPNEFATKDGYETVSLIYYADGVLADEENEIIDDVDTLVGADSLKTFGEFEDDSVHVRNDVLKCDYEILRDLRKYEDVINRRARFGLTEG